MPITPKTMIAFPARLPPDAKDWLEQQARLNLSSINSEMVRCVRAEMGRHGASKPMQPAKASQGGE